MTISEVLTKIDDLKSNAYTAQEKIGWLSLADAMVGSFIEVQFPDAQPFPGYTVNTPVDTVLKVPEPFCDLYLHWLSAQMDLYNGEITRFNNSMALFSDRFRAYENFCRRNTLPLGRKMHIK